MTDILSTQELRRALMQIDLSAWQRGINNTMDDLRVFVSFTLLDNGFDSASEDAKKVNADNLATYALWCAESILNKANAISSEELKEGAQLNYWRCIAIAKQLKKR